MAGGVVVVVASLPIVPCQVCNKPGHVALQCYHSFDNPYTNESRPNMQALLATPTANQDLNWYTDSSATHHLTTDLANLNLRADDYNGPDQIRVVMVLG